MFPAVIQDNRRGLLFGTRTMGAGGSVFGDRLLGYPATIYSDGGARFTVALMVRKDPIVTPDFPTVPYIENIGVRPDIEADYMTRENLLNRGRAFVETFTAAIVEHIRKSQ